MKQTQRQRERKPRKPKGNKSMHELVCPSAFAMNNLFSSEEKDEKTHRRRAPERRKRGRGEEEDEDSTTEVDTHVVVPSTKPKSHVVDRKEKGKRIKEKFVWDTPTGNK